jgi:ADP-ribose pyrophosphatase YjhB (NUDIX family)
MARSAGSGETIEVCAVPYRVRDGRIEFCLVSPPGSSRWEFPQLRVVAREPIKRAAIRCAKEVAGVGCRHHGLVPLDSFSTNQERSVSKLTAFLVVARSEKTLDADCRCRWCLPEEARARIRRKPMRRLIDLALRRIAEEAASGECDQKK